VTGEAWHEHAIWGKQASAKRRRLGATMLDLLEAKKRMTEAKALYGKGDFEQARLKYVEACSIARTDNCVRSLAVAELAAGRPADAYVHFQEVQRGAGAARLDPRAAKELNELVQEAYAKCGHVEVSAPGGTLLAIDDQAAAGVPADVIAVAPGTHTFEATRGDRHKRVVQDAPVGKVVRVVFTEDDLAPVAVTAPVVPATTTVTMSGGPTPAVYGEAEKRTWPPIGAWVLGGVGLAGIGVGIGFAVDAGSQRNTVSGAGNACANLSSSACGKILDAQSALKRDYVIDAVAFGAGGAALGAALLWTLIAPHGSSSTTALTPDFGPSHAGLRLNSTF
jgi:hypothetical protein